MAASGDQDKDLSGTYVELAKLSQESFLNRRSYEWKVAFGLWAGIALLTNFVISNDDKVDVPLCLLGFSYVLFVGLWLAFWQAPMRRAFEQDKQWKHYYMDRAEGEKRDKPSTVTHEELMKSGDHFWWNYGQTVVTALFLFLSFLLIANRKQSSPPKESPPQTGRHAKEIDSRSTEIKSP